MSVESRKKAEELLVETIDEVDDALLYLVIGEGYKKFETRQKHIRRAIEAIDRYVGR